MQSDIRMFEAILTDASERIQTIERMGAFITDQDTVSYHNALDSIKLKRSEILQLVEEVKESPENKWKVNEHIIEESLDDLVRAMEKVEEEYVL